ncbi:unnamed protein product [Peniophora sp. CBMAI 1063]|nr:unnamed protein product [Peniophora sp. CBMAI 1063]
MRTPNSSPRDATSALPSPPPSSPNVSRHMAPSRREHMSDGPSLEEEDELGVAIEVEDGAEDTIPLLYEDSETVRARRIVESYNFHREQHMQDCDRRALLNRLSSRGMQVPLFREFVDKWVARTYPAIEMDALEHSNVNCDIARLLLWQGSRPRFDNAGPEDWNTHDQFVECLKNEVHAATDGSMDEAKLKDLEETATAIMDQEFCVTGVKPHQGGFDVQSIVKPVPGERNGECVRLWWDFWGEIRREVQLDFVVMKDQQAVPIETPEGWQIWRVEDRMRPWHLTGGHEPLASLERQMGHVQVEPGEEKWLLQQGDHIMIVRPGNQKPIYLDVPETVWPDERYGEETKVEVLHFD